MKKIKILLQIQDPYGNQYMLKVSSDSWGVLKYSLTDQFRSTAYSINNMGWKNNPPITVHDYDNVKDVLCDLLNCVEEYTTYSVNKTVAALQQTKDGTVKEIKNVWHNR
jgi:hypothetical protein